MDAVVTHGDSRILVVEDDGDFRECLVEVLEDDGNTVAVAGNGEEALAYLKASARLPDLIILDLMMPSMDGAEFREHQMLNPAWSRIPVLVLTADGDFPSKMGSLRAGGYVKKPVRIEPLLELVHEVLAARAHGVMS